MTAVVQRKYGSADVLELDEIELPTIGPAEVMIEVHAAGLDRGTWHLMAGQPYLIRLTGLRAPRNLVAGFDIAGSVAAVGAGVTRFAVGDEVFGIGKGSFAGYACARESKLVHKPASLSFEQAAVVTVSGLPALRALRDVGQVHAGQRVLIIGASGGVGTAAVQIAKAAGAEVTGVCSTTKMDLVRSIGADKVIDYTREDFTSGTQRYDLILDIAGNSPLSRLRRVLTRDGTLVIVGGEDGDRWTGGMGRQLRALAISPFVRQRLTSFIPKEHHTDIERLSELVEAGQLTPVIDRTWSLRDTPDAMRYLVAGHARGKLVIAIKDEGPPGVPS
jgi:NADPH:quinone reductase-like Zn-dependent oxidoreductase